MKITVRIVQVLVGVLFIVSGLVKANDPLGLSYKMQEFFELWNSSLSAGHFFARHPLIGFFEFFHDHSLFLSIVMITLEIVTGIALLLGWRKKFILWLLLLLIVFFTFLTGYAYLSGKFTNCGCFGDCLPITPLTSFTKDVVLLVFIVLLLVGRRYIQPLGRPRMRASVLSTALVLSLLLQWYVLNYLPLADCLPFKKGNNIAAQMKPPPGSIPDSIAILFIYEKGGKRFEFTQDQLPADFDTYTYIDRVDRLVRKGNAEPAIKGFSLTDTSGQDLTSMVLTQPQALLFFALDLDNINSWRNDLKKITALAQQKGVPVYFATSQPAEVTTVFIREGITMPVYACDFTVIRTAARTNPTLYALRSGTIVDKYGRHHLDKAAAFLDQTKK
jgi:uncharacterized membrane protein YphA (DoxX/SURF4 family)